MKGEMLEAQDFSTWDGKPFFDGYPEEGRHVYIVKTQEHERFTAYGALDDQQQVIFVVRGSLGQLDGLVAQVKAEGARVTHGLPPIDTNTGGDKSTSTSRPGIQGDRGGGIKGVRGGGTQDGSGGKK